MKSYFHETAPIRFAGAASTDPLAFRHYEPDRLVLGKRMAEHLRFAVCYWHSFSWNGLINPRRNEARRSLARLVAQLDRVLPDGDGMHVNQTVNRLDPLILLFHKALQRPKVIAQRQPA